MPPLAAFFMKVLSFSDNEELFPAGVAVCAIAAGPMLSAAVTEATIQNFDISKNFVFMAFVGSETAGTPRYLRNRKEDFTWTRMNCNLLTFAAQSRARAVASDRDIESNQGPEIF